MSERIEITSSDVVDSYKRQNITPAFEDWGYTLPLSNTFCACAITAVIADKFGIEQANKMLDEIGHYEGNGEKIPAQLLGWNEREVLWFTQGYDDGKMSDAQRRNQGAECLSWHDLGAECREAVSREFGLNLDSQEE